LRSRARSSGVQSTCGLIRRRGAVISRGARVTAPAVVTMPYSPSRRARAARMSWPLVARSAVMAEPACVGPVTVQPGSSARASRVCLPTSASRDQIRDGPAWTCCWTAAHRPIQAATFASVASSSHSGPLSAGRAPRIRAEAPIVRRSHHGSATATAPAPRGPVSHFRLVA
jgi:hypothetical protein